MRSVNHLLRICNVSQIGMAMSKGGPLICQVACVVLGVMSNYAQSLQGFASATCLNIKMQRVCEGVICKEEVFLRL